MSDESSFYCDVSALSATERADHTRVSEGLRPIVTGVEETDKGYRLHVPGDRWLDVAQFVDYESRCCPFLTFELRLEAQQAGLAITISGPEGVKPFLRAELGLE